MNSEIRAVHLTCAGVENPIGADPSNITLSWRVSAGRQTAYRIVISSLEAKLDNEDYDIWDSGFTEDESCIFVPAENISAVSGARFFWKVALWDENRGRGLWSETAFFEFGLLKRGDWHGKWIASPSGWSDAVSSVPAPLFRREFNISEPVESARAYVCGLGFHEISLNGKKLDSRELEPAFTRYDRSAIYSVYTIDPSDIVYGKNVFGAELGNGWYNCFAKDEWHFETAEWRHCPKLLFEARILFKSGKEIFICSGSDWKTADGPVLMDGIRNGEIYDANLADTGWSTPEYNSENWIPAVETAGPGGVLKPTLMPPVRICRILEPVSCNIINERIRVYDLGVSVAGRAEIELTAEKGSEIVLRYAERLYPDGRADREHISKMLYSGEFQTEKYICCGKERESYHSKFTYHGFRYVEAEFLNGGVTDFLLRGQYMHTDFESAGFFECSDQTINKLQQCTLRSTLNNFFGLPTDCPHREKLGWTGDALLSAQHTLLNFNAMTAYEKWLEDFIDAQRISGQLPGVIPTNGFGYNWGNGPAWDGALIQLPWYVYVYTGNKHILAANYNAMKKYMNFLDGIAVKNIVNYGLGDWNSPDRANDDYKCPAAFSGTAYYYRDAVILSDIALILGKSDEHKFYKALSEEIKQSFRREFIDLKNVSAAGNCQASTAIAIDFGMLNPQEIPLFAELLKRQVEEKGFKVDTGILGTKALLFALSETGNSDIAYRLVTQTEYPGWGWWLANGATTLWGNWDGKSSRDHHMFGCVSQWFYECLAGIRPDPSAPGFRRFCFKPALLKAVSSISCSHMCMYGEISAEIRFSGDIFTAVLSVPAGCTAVICLAQEKRTVSFRPRGGEWRRTCGIFELCSGEYELSVDLQGEN